MGQSVKAWAGHESHSWLACKTLTEDDAWVPRPSESADCVRTIAWEEKGLTEAQNKLTELGVKRLLRSPRTWMFHLTRLEAGPEIGRFSQYFIAREGLLKVMHSSIVLARPGEDIDEYTARTDKGVKESQAFMIENDLLAPNAEDKSELLEILNRGSAITGAVSLETAVRKD